MEFLLYIFAIVVMIVAQSSVDNAYRRYRTIKAGCNYTGEEVARMILDNNGLNHVIVEQSRGGTLSDHFDPKANVVRLSPDVYNGRSIASVAVAAHECGHAIQHATKYFAIDIRNAILPFAVVSGNLGWTAIVLGLLASYNPLINVGIIMLLVIATFQVVTLPIEFDASNRALKILENGYLEYDEVDDAKKMLKAAAFTYVASLISTLVNLLRVILIRNRNNDR